MIYIPRIDWVLLVDENKNFVISERITNECWEYLVEQWEYVDKDPLSKSFIEKIDKKWKEHNKKD